MNTANAFPSAKAAADCFAGVPGGCADSVGFLFWRMALLGTGMALAGERRDLLKKTFAASMAVQTVVMVDTLMRPPDQRGQVLSSLAALSGNPAAIVATWLGRAAMAWAGLQLAGQKENAWRNALAGTAAIEIVVLHWANGHGKDTTP